MRKTPRKLNSFLFLALILVGIFWSCETASKKPGSLIEFIPEDAALVLKVKEFSNLHSDLNQSDILEKFIGQADALPSPNISKLLFSKEESLLKNLKPSSESLLCFTRLNDSTSTYTFISKQTKNIISIDSIKNKTIESLDIDGLKLQRISIGKDIAYSAEKDSVFIASSSQSLLLDILRGKTKLDADFKKVYNLPSINGISVLLKNNKLALNDSTSINMQSWSSMDLHLNPDSFMATGITMMPDTIHHLFKIFEEQVPQQNDIAALIPHDAKAALSFTFSDSEKLQKKLSEFRNEKSNNPHDIFGPTNEVGEIQLQDESIIFMKSIDASLGADAIARYVSTEASFRDVDIKSFGQPDLFYKTFSPLISSKNANYVFQVDSFFVFTEKQTTAESMISLILNNATLKNASYFEKASADLSNASSLLLFNLNGDFSNTLAGFFKLSPQDNFEKLNFKNIPIAAFQFTFDRNFAHVIVSAKETGTASAIATGRVTEKFNLKLENDILGEPQFFSNSRGGGSSILIQDIKNQLHFISENGKILWSKNLKSPIIGKIQEVDIYGNGNIQMAFTTKNAFYILDRTGKDISSFPLRFKDEVTQALSVFDYDNNHKYRFIITQGKNLLMYDKNGKMVRGFGFNKTSSTIVQAPKHIRMGNKDYILVAEESGKLNILSRVGRSRINVSKTFKFSEIPVTHEDNSFVVITKDNVKEMISETGKVSSTSLDVGGHYWFAINGKTKATLDDNLLRIDGKLTELPLGIYSNPQLFSINGNIYTSITETQEKKVYVFDKNASLLNGFPIYGSYKASLGKNTTKNGFGIVVKDASNSIIGYEI